MCESNIEETQYFSIICAKYLYILWQTVWYLGRIILEPKVSANFTVEIHLTVLLYANSYSRYRGLRRQRYHLALRLGKVIFYLFRKKFTNTLDSTSLKRRNAGAHYKREPIPAHWPSTDLAIKIYTEWCHPAPAQYADQLSIFSSISTCSFPPWSKYFPNSSTLTWISSNHLMAIHTVGRTHNVTGRFTSRSFLFFHII